MNSERFDVHVETQLVPTLRPGDAVILDNLPCHKRSGAARALRDIGAWFRCSGKTVHWTLFFSLQPAALQHRPETGLRPFRSETIHRIISGTPFTPIEMVFSKLKALIRKAAARTYDGLWKTAGHVCNLFTDEECYYFFKAAGYRTD